MTKKQEQEILDLLERSLRITLHHGEPSDGAGTTIVRLWLNDKEISKSKVQYIDSYTASMM